MPFQRNYFLFGVVYLFYFYTSHLYQFNLIVVFLIELIELALAYAVTHRIPGFYAACVLELGIHRQKTKKTSGEKKQYYEMK